MGCASVKATQEAQAKTGTAKKDLPNLLTPEEAEEQRKIKAARKKQRLSVSGPSISVADVQVFEKPTYAKDETQEALIRQTLSSNDKMHVILGHLDSERLQDVVNAFRPHDASGGEDIIKQGAEGDALYIVAEGSVEIFISKPAPNEQDPNSKGIKVASLGAGSLFGELALLYSAPRAATVTVSSASAKFWALDQQPFKMLLMQNSQNQYQTYEGWLKEVSIFKVLSTQEIRQLSELLEGAKQSYIAGENIITQGDVGDKFYILEDGSASVWINTPSGEKEVKTYWRGDYFGEFALLTGDPRKATVRAGADGATALWLSKEDFTNLLGPLKAELEQGMIKTTSEMNC